MTITTAVIMAAGLGSRIPEFSRQQPKGFINIGGQTLIERSLDILVRHGIDHIIIGTGYLASDYVKLAENYPSAQIDCVFNPIYEQSGSLETLLQCTECLNCDFLTLESDLFYDSRMIERILSAPFDNAILASGTTHSGDEVYIETNEQGALLRLSKDATKLQRIDAELVGICKLTAQIPTTLKRWLQQTGQTRPNMLHYEEGLMGIANTLALPIEKTDLLWTEIDTLAHLERANQLILPNILSQES